MSKYPHDKIRNLYATGKYSQRALASRFGCDRSTIGRIVRVQDDAEARGCVTVTHCPNDLFNCGRFSIADFVFGALRLNVCAARWPDRNNLPFVVADGDDSIARQPLDGIVWANGTRFEIGKNGSVVRAECRDGRIWHQDGRVLEPRNNGAVKWVEADK